MLAGKHNDWVMNAQAWCVPRQPRQTENHAVYSLVVQIFLNMSYDHTSSGQLNGSGEEENLFLWV